MNTHLSTIATSLDWSVRYSNGFGFLGSFISAFVWATFASQFSKIIQLKNQTPIWATRYILNEVKSECGRKKSVMTLLDNNFSFFLNVFIPELRGSNKYVFLDFNNITFYSDRLCNYF